VQPWQAGRDRVVSRERVFTLKRRWCASRTNPRRAGDFVYLDAGDWCNVLATTPEGHFVMVEQYRIGIGAVSLELVGGIIDPGESPVAAGERELLEETGYRGLCRGVMGVVSANAAILNNLVHTIRITDCVPAGSTRFDENEELRTRIVPPEDVPALVRCGLIHHALVVAALFHHEASKANGL
jgi:8-oxo-dGTP pyrophosphatase MutT (NUDIX family)